jgi:uncharacterized protein (TIGR02217 family)
MSILLFPSLSPAIPIKRTIVGSVTKQQAISGARLYFPQWTYPQYRYELSFELLRSYGSFTEWQQMQGFLGQQFSSAEVFNYNDPDDGSVTNQLTGEGDGTTASFQLVRTLGGSAEPVFSVYGTPSVSVDGTPVSSSYWSISNYGVLTFAGGHIPAATKLITWTGTYYWYCRLDNDEYTFSKFASGFRSMDSLMFSTEHL